MSNIINHREDLLSYIKSVILKYCPYTEDRLSISGSAKSPELDIEFNICNNESQITFLFGNRNFKTNIPERATTSYIISFEEICNIIDYLLEDHEIIKDISFDNSQIDLKFAINWTDKSVKGINCGDIDLNLNFENIKVKKHYLYLLFQRYNNHLEQTSSFKSLKNKYINNMKQLYFESLDKTKLIALLNKMSEKELRYLLYSLDNDIFVKYIMDDGKQLRTKKLSLEKHNLK